LDGAVTSTVDIRRPTQVEMEYEVLQAGHVLVPSLHVFNEEGVCVCIVQDLDPAWRGRARPVGRYVSSACIPGNFLAEGTFIVGAALSTHVPLQIHFQARDAVAFRVVDSIDGDSARGDLAGPMAGVVRPIWDWQTRLLPSEEGCAWN
jgi:lipopolysaccharide transport system ATP-binding protein